MYIEHYSASNKPVSPNTHSEGEPPIRGTTAQCPALGALPSSAQCHGRGQLQYGKCTESFSLYG